MSHLQLTVGDHDYSVEVREVDHDYGTASFGSHVEVWRKNHCGKGYTADVATLETLLTELALERGCGIDDAVCHLEAMATEYEAHRFEE